MFTFKPLLILKTLMIALVSFTACSSPQANVPATPPTLGSNYTGLWRGEVTDNIGNADVDIALTQAGTSLTGELLLSFSVGLSQATAKGTVSGRVNETRAELWLVPEDKTYCAYHAVANRSENRLEGSYVGIDCKEDIQGTLTLKKQ